MHPVGGTCASSVHGRGQVTEARPRGPIWFTLLTVTADNERASSAARPVGTGRERGNARLRAFDRFAGIPIVAAAGLVRRRRPLPPAVRRIGILNGTAIGDTIVLSPVAADIAAAYPDAETLFFANRAMVPLLDQLGTVTPVPIRIANARAAVATLRCSRLDVLLDFDSWPRVEPVYALLSGAAFTAGFRAVGQHRHYAYDAVAEHSSALHELDNYRRVAALLDVVSRSDPILRPTGTANADELPPRPYVVLHLWPTGVHSHLKEWPAARWRALVAELGRRGHAVVLTGGPADIERSAAFAASCAGSGARVVDAAGRYPLDQLVDVVVGSRCVVAVNTGIAHLAAAAGASTFTLNGPTSAARWGPIGRRAVGLDSELPGCGYLNFGWEYKGLRHDCMDGIGVDRVLQALRGALHD